MTTELKPCPFCGSEAAEPDGNNHTWCSDTSCGSDAYLSVEAWNRRTKPGKPESGVLAEAVKVPEGWQLVPKEPTPNMTGAWYRYKNGHHWPDEPTPRDTSDYGAYRAMLAAAPSPTDDQR